MRVFSNRIETFHYGHFDLAPDTELEYLVFLQTKVSLSETNYMTFPRLLMATHEQKLNAQSPLLFDASKNSRTIKAGGRMHILRVYLFHSLIIHLFLLMLF